MEISAAHGAAWCNRSRGFRAQSRVDSISGDPEHAVFRVAQDSARAAVASQSQACSPLVTRRTASTNASHVLRWCASTRRPSVVTL